MNAQQLVTDSLKNLLGEAEGESRVFLLNQLGSQLREVSPQEAMDFSLEAESLAHALDNKSGEARAKENIGWIYYRKGQWQKTFDYSKEAYELAMEAGDLKQAASVLNNLGALYYEQHNFKEAIEEFKEAYRISSELSDHYTVIRSLNNIAFNFIQIDLLDSAVLYAQRAIGMNAGVEFPYLTSFAHRVMGDVYVKRNQLDSAEAIFGQILANGDLHWIPSFKASLLHRLGYIYLQSGRLEEAEQALREGIATAEVNGLLDELSKNHRYLAQVFEQRKNYKEAYRHQSIFLNLNDSLMNKSSRDRIALLQGMFEEDLSRTELDLLKSQNENQANRLEFIRMTNMVIVMAIILISGLSVWLIFLIRNVNKYNKDLIEQQQKIHRQNLDLEAKSRQLEVINQTKNKLFSILGHDLRGPIGQVKSIVELLLIGDLSKDEFAELLHSLRKDVDSVYFTLNNTLRWSIGQMEGFKLNSSQIDLHGLVMANLGLLHPQFREKEIEVLNFVSQETTVFADPDLLDVIIRNILNNAIKFSKPGGVIQVTSQEFGGWIEWCVIDQGIGMSEEQIHRILGEDYVITHSQAGTKKEKGSGLGLQICKEFARMMNGKLLIESTSGKGTVVSVKLPLHPLQNHLDIINSEEVI